MEIKVRKLDDAYLSIEELNHDLLDNSSNFSTDIIRLMNSIGEHWQGSDASSYINEWTKEYDNFSTYFDGMNKITNYLQNYFVNLQVCRSRANGNRKTGDKIKNKCAFQTLEKKPPTASYYYDEKLEQDYAILQELCKKYAQFLDKTNNAMDGVFQNWQMGQGRKEVQEELTTMTHFSKSVYKEMEILKDKLGTVIMNNKKISRL